MDASRSHIYSSILNPCDTDIFIYKGANIGLFVPALKIVSDIELMEEGTVCHVREMTRIYNKFHSISRKRKVSEEKTSKRVKVRGLERFCWSKEILSIIRQKRHKRQLVCIVPN